MMMYSPFTEEQSKYYIIFIKRFGQNLFVSLYREQKYSENINLGRESAWTFAESGHDWAAVEEAKYSSMQHNEQRE